MPGQTTHGAPYPVLGDAPDVPAYVQDLAEWTDEQLWTRPPSTHAYRAAALALSSTGADAAVVWTESARDTGGMWTDNSSRITAPVAGLYKAVVRVGFGNYTAPSKTLIVRKNSAGSVSGGTPLWSAADSTGAGGSNPPLFASVEEAFNAGDYYEVFVAQTSGSTQANGLLGGQATTFTQARRVSA